MDRSRPISVSERTWKEVRYRSQALSASADSGLALERTFRQEQMERGQFSQMRTSVFCHLIIIVLNITFILQTTTQHHDSASL